MNREGILNKESLFKSLMGSGEKGVSASPLNSSVNAPREQPAAVSPSPASDLNVAALLMQQDRMNQQRDSEYRLQTTVNNLSKDVDEIRKMVENSSSILSRLDLALGQISNEVGMLKKSDTLRDAKIEKLRLKMNDIDLNTKSVGEAVGAYNRSVQNKIGSDTTQNLMMQHLADMQNQINCALKQQIPQVPQVTKQLNDLALIEQLNKQAYLQHFYGGQIPQQHAMPQQQFMIPTLPNGQHFAVSQPQPMTSRMFQQAPVVPQSQALVSHSSPPGQPRPPQQQIQQIQKKPEPIIRPAAVKPVTVAQAVQPVSKPTGTSTISYGAPQAAAVRKDNAASKSEDSVSGISQMGGAKPNSPQLGNLFSLSSGKSSSAAKSSAPANESASGSGEKAAGGQGGFAGKPFVFGQGASPSNFSFGLKPKDAKAVETKADEETDNDEGEESGAKSGSASGTEPTGAKPFTGFGGFGKSGITASDLFKSVGAGSEGGKSAFSFGQSSSSSGAFTGFSQLSTGSMFGSGEKAKQAEGEEKAAPENPEEFAPQVDFKPVLEKLPDRSAAHRPHETADDTSEITSVRSRTGSRNRARGTRRKDELVR